MKQPDEAGYGLLKIFEERLEQLKKHGYDARHDDGHRNGELARAADCILRGLSLPALREESGWMTAPVDWPWEPESWRKVLNHDTEGRLAIAGALIAAEIDRVNRAHIAGTLHKRTPEDAIFGARDGCAPAGRMTDEYLGTKR